MRKMILTLLTLFFVGSMFSQEKTNYEKYDELVYCAMINFKDKNYKNSLENFQKAFKIIPNDLVDDYFYAAAAALILNNDEEAKKIIIESILQTNASKDYFLNFEEFNQFRDRKLFDEIFKNYAAYQSEFFRHLPHPEIYKEVESLMSADQEVRISGGNMLNIDTNNINRLIEITKKYGWHEKGWIILWHQRGTYGEDNYVWTFFKPFIDEQIEKGNMRKDFWARFDEEKSIETTGKQIYGMYWSQYNNWPIKDIENVDERRQSVGLRPLWYMDKVYGIKPPKEYTKSITSIDTSQCGS